MPPKKNEKKRSKKGIKRSKDAEKLLEEELLKRRFDLQKTKDIIVDQISRLMTKRRKMEDRILVLRARSNELKENLSESVLYLERKLSQCDNQIKELGTTIKNIANDNETLEKTIATETAKIEDEHNTTKSKLLSDFEWLAMKLSLTNMFKIKHREMMELCLEREETLASLETECASTLQNYENKSIVQISQLQDTGEKHLNSLLQIASEYFEKQVLKRTHDVLRENLVLSGQADRVFESWLRRADRMHYSLSDKQTTYLFEADLLRENIYKLETILADLTNVRAAEILKIQSHDSLENRAILLAQENEILNEQLERTQHSTLELNLKNQEMSAKYKELLKTLTAVLEYACALNNQNIQFNLVDYEEIAAKIVEKIGEFKYCD